MKKHLLLAVAFLALVSPAFAQTTPLPKIITDGFAAYQAAGSAKAVTAWLTGSPVGNATNISSLTSYYAGLDTSEGKYLGYEYVGVITLSPSIKEYYTSTLYQNGFIFNWFEVYTVNGKDVLTSYNNGPTAATILPASFLVKDRVKP